VYLGPRDGSDGTEEEFSLRPLSGTTSVRASGIISVQEYRREAGPMKPLRSRDQSDAVPGGDG
jgi:hypothetical protein